MVPYQNITIAPVYISFWYLCVWPGAYIGPQAIIPRARESSPTDLVPSQWNANPMALPWLYPIPMI